MKYLILALLAATFSAFVATAEAGTTIKCGSGDPMKNLNLHKSGGGGKGGPLCADAGGSERVIKGTKSNTSDVDGAVGRTTVNGTKSNSYRLEGGKNDADLGHKNSGHASERTKE